MGTRRSGKSSIQKVVFHKMVSAKVEAEASNSMHCVPRTLVLTAFLPALVRRCVPPLPLAASLLLTSASSQSPHETLFLESANDIRLRDISTSALVQFQLLDFPGSFDFS